MPAARANWLAGSSACHQVPRRIHWKPNGVSSAARTVSASSQAAGAATASGKRRASRRRASPAPAV